MMIVSENSVLSEKVDQFGISGIVHKHNSLLSGQLGAVMLQS